MGVIDAKIHENGMVAMTSSLTLLEVKGWTGGRPMVLANPSKWYSFCAVVLRLELIGLSEPPHSWSVIPPDITISRHAEVLLSVDNTIHTVDNLESVDQRLSRGPFTHISPSPNGKSLALLTFNAMLWVVSSDFQRSMADFDTSNVPGATGSVRQIEWCGNDAILVTWDSLVILVGPFGDSLQCVCMSRSVKRGTHHICVDISTLALL